MTTIRSIVKKHNLLENPLTKKITRKILNTAKECGVSNLPGGEMIDSRQPFRRLSPEDDVDNFNSILDKLYELIGIFYMDDGKYKKCHTTHDEDYGWSVYFDEAEDFLIEFAKSPWDYVNLNAKFTK